MARHGIRRSEPDTGAGGYLQQGNGYTYSEPVTFHLRYPGQQWDEETGLAYNLHWYYGALPEMLDRLHF